MESQMKDKSISGYKVTQIIPFPKRFKNEVCLLPKQGTKSSRRRVWGFEG